MPTLVITREDLLRGKIIPPGWYRLKIKNIEEAAATTDGSTNTTVSLIVVQEGECKDVPLKRVFNEKAPGFATSFIEAIQRKRIAEEGGSFELSNSVGQEVFGYVKTGTWQGRQRNEVEDFLPIGDDGRPMKL